MEKARYEEIKNTEENLNGIARMKYLAEELSEKERTEYFEYRNFIEMQKFLTGII